MSQVSLKSIKSAVYVNIITISKGFYNKNGIVIGPLRMACLKVGCVDNEESTTNNRNLEIRIKEHENKYDGKSIPLMIYNCDHPRKLEAKIKKLLKDERLNIMYKHNADISRVLECYPLSLNIIQRIQNIKKIGKVTYPFDKLKNINTEKDFETFVDDLIPDYGTPKIMDSIEDSLTQKQAKILKQNSVWKYK